MIFLDLEGTLYSGRVVQQFPTRGKLSIEIIKDLHVYVIELIKEFAVNNGQMPNKLVFYRSGVDDGSFQKVLDNEVRSIERACQGSVSLLDRSIDPM